MTNESEAPITITLKAGTGYDAPWLVIRGFNPEDVELKLKSLDGVIAATHEATASFALGQIAAPAQQQAPPQQQKPRAWGANAGQQQAAPQQRQGGNHPSAQLHPEGKTCAVCPNILEYKKTQSGKPKWQCPDWRWNNGNPNDHSQEWIN